MGLFDWFKRWRRAPAPVAEPVAEAPAPVAAELEPEPLWRIGCDGDTLWMSDPQGARKTLPLAELIGVAIEGSDGGPTGLDYWWLFYGADEDLAFAAPLGSAGEAALVDRLATLPGFRHDRYAAARDSQDIDTFVLWQRPFD